MATIENLRVGDRIADKYVVERVLGQGGMGIVVAARHVELDQSFAIKFVLPDALRQPGIADRLLREARASAKLRSEHAARVTDVGRTPDGAPYLVMELLEGQDLAAMLEQRGTLPAGEAALYVAQACEAIGEAHAAGIIHRDIKPANLFVTTRRDGSPCVKVLDFGIAKEDGMTSASMTSTGAVLGTPLYMSPEQVKSSKTATPSTDLWALGVTLYELTTGTIPYDVTTVTELIGKILTEAPIPARVRNPSISVELERVIMGCLQLDPGARHRSAADLRAALLPFVQPELAGHRPPLTSFGAMAPHAVVSGVTPAPLGSSSAAGSAQEPHPSPRDPRLLAPRTESGTTSNVTVPRPSSRGPILALGAVAALGVLGGGAAFFLTRAPTPASTVAPQVSAEVTPSAPAASSAPEAPPDPGPPSSVSVSVEAAAPEPSASAPPAAAASPAEAGVTPPAPTAKRPPARPPERPRPPATGAPAPPGTNKPGWGGML